MINTLQSTCSPNVTKNGGMLTGKKLLLSAEERTQFAMGENILLSMKDITAHSHLSDKYFYALIKRGLFPRPIKIGRSSRWRKNDYEMWLNERDTSRKSSGK
ncbi:helix-turn-helix transcriptional regulator [Citrobacter freundii]